MIGQYKIITLCGSTRFKDEFLQEQKRLTLLGNIVISVGLFSHSDNETESLDEKTVLMLNDIHKRKIDMADEIFIINKNGYIGESTKAEIEYAKERHKEIKYLEPIIKEEKDKPIYCVNCYTCQHCQQDTCKGCRTILNGEDEPYENWELREDLQQKDEQIAELKKVTEELAGQLVAIYEHENYTYGDRALDEDFPGTLTKYGNREDPVVVGHIIERYTEFVRNNKGDK